MDLSILFSHSPINERICHYLEFEDAVALQQYLGPIVLIYQCVIKSFILEGITPFTQKIYRLLKKKKIEDVLIDSIQYADREVSQFLIENAPHNHEIFWSNHGLVTAARVGDLPSVQLLLERECDIDEQLQEYTPLTVAIKHNQSEVVNFLLEQGANPNKCPFGYNFSPLIMSVVYGRRDFLDLLLKYQVNLHLEMEYALKMAVQFLQFDILQYLYDLSQERNIPIFLTQTLSDIPFDWFDFCDREKTEQQRIFMKIVYFLVEKGANLATDQGEHVLYEAVSYKIPKLVRYFLDHSVQINTNNNRIDGTILHDAVRSRSLPIIRMLLESGRVQEIINFTDQKGRTALKLAKKAKIKELLKKYGAS